jgi:hypothetical protein
MCGQALPRGSNISDISLLNKLEEGEYSYFLLFKYSGYGSVDTEIDKNAFVIAKDCSLIFPANGAPLNFLFRGYVVWLSYSVDYCLD